MIKKISPDFFGKNPPPLTGRYLFEGKILVLEYRVQIFKLMGAFRSFKLN